MPGGAVTTVTVTVTLGTPKPLNYRGLSGAKFVIVIVLHLLLFDISGAEGRPPAGLPTQRGPEEVWRNVGLAEAMVLVCILFGATAGKIKERIGFLIRLGMAKVLSATYLNAYLSEGGSLREGTEDYFDWLVDNYQAQEFLQEYGENLQEHHELESAFGHHLWEDER